MRTQFKYFGAAALALVLAGAVPAYGKSITMSNITIDMPSTFEASDSERGMKTETSDGEVDVWFERYAADGLDQFVSENRAYWKDNKVTLPTEPTMTQGKFGAGQEYQQLDYPDATWKGKPTIVRYVFFRPSSDPKADMIVVTIWASPEGDTAHSSEITDMIVSSKVN